MQNQGSQKACELAPAFGCGQAVRHRSLEPTSLVRIQAPEPTL